MKSVILRITLGFTLILSLASASAQSIKKKGWLVLNSGDTLHGWFNYRNWEKNPASVSFSKDSLTSNFSRYSKHDLQSIYVNGLDYYQKFVVTKDARPVKLPDLLPADIDSLVLDTALLRVLVHGNKYTLFELMDEKVHYFIKPANSDIKELEFKVVNVENGSMTEQKTYIRQLKAFLHDSRISTDFLRKIDQATYTEKKLKEIVREMNTSSGNVEYVAPVTAKKVITSFFVGAGAGISSLKFSGQNTALKGMDYATSFLPFATIGFDIATGRNLQAIVFRPELSFTTISYQGTATGNVPFGSSEPYTTTYKVLQTNISPSLGLLYNFIRKEATRVYIGAGASYNFSFYKNNVYTQNHPTAGTKQTDNYLDFPTGWLTFSGKLGFKLNKKIEIALNSQFIGSFTNYLTWGYTPQTHTAQLRYFFD